MAETVVTKEHFDNTITEEQIQKEIQLRYKAGAQKSWVERNGGWLLYAEWAVMKSNNRTTPKKSLNMAETVITKEHFEKSVPRDQIEKEKQLRIKAGALRSWIEEQQDGWLLCSEWAVYRNNE